MFNARHQVQTVEELISHLEHVEIDQLQSDISANVRAELRYMKKNTSAILAFVSATEGIASDSELYQAMTAVKRECIALNGMISKSLLMLLVPIDAVRSRSELFLADQYASLARKTLALCALSAPQLTEDLATAL